MLAIVNKLHQEFTWLFTVDKFRNIPNQNLSIWYLLWPLPLAFGMLGLRYLLSRFCFIPLGLYLNKDLNTKGKKSLQVHPNELLEDVYNKNINLSHSQILALSKRTDLSERQIERWFRFRKVQDRPGKVIKFCEECWKFTYYTSLFVYGLVILWNKSWLWDIKHIWNGFLKTQVITNDIWWYYMISLSFYWSLFFGQFQIDIKRKDHWQMFIHHIATLLLISFSWICGALRIGSLVLLVHDAADIFLAAAKLTKYIKYNTTAVSLFIFFLIIWTITRLGVYPFWIVKHCLLESPLYTPQDFPYYTFSFLLCTLLALHCYWSYLIFRFFVNMVGKKAAKNDERSSTEDDSGD